MTFLGTGTSQGIPLIGCDCEVCSSDDPRDDRFRSSIMIELEDQVIVVDSGPDFRSQMLRAGVKRLDALLFTHEHRDHTAGLDEIRAFNYWTKQPVSIFATLDVQAYLKRSFEYIFSDRKYPGIPEVDLQTIDNQLFRVNDVAIQPIPVMHHHMPVLGFRIHNMAYITDANYIPESSFALLEGLDVLVLNALRHESHISHFTLSEAIEVARRIGATTTYFTHISHQLGLHHEVSRALPAAMHLAHDGLAVELTPGA